MYPGVAEFLNYKWCGRNNSRAGLMYKNHHQLLNIYNKIGIIFFFGILWKHFVGDLH